MQRLFFRESLGDEVLAAARHLSIDVHRDEDGSVHVSFDLSGNLTPGDPCDDDDEGSQQLSPEDAERETKRAIDLAGKLVRSFAANGKGGE